MKSRTTRVVFTILTIVVLIGGAGTFYAASRGPSASQPQTINPSSEGVHNTSIPTTPANPTTPTSPTATTTPNSIGLKLVAIWIVLEITTPR